MGNCSVSCLAAGGPSSGLDVYKRQVLIVLAVSLVRYVTSRGVLKGAS